MWQSVWLFEYTMFNGFHTKSIVTSNYCKLLLCNAHTSRLNHKLESAHISSVIIIIATQFPRKLILRPYLCSAVKWTFRILNLTSVAGCIEIYGSINRMHWRRYYRRLCRCYVIKKTKSSACRWYNGDMPADTITPKISSKCLRRVCGVHVYKSMMV